jgi:filamentous hemagglutinin
LGNGNVIVKDTANSDDLERLNTNTSKINKDLYSSSISTSVDATLDTRLLTEEGREQIKEEYKDLDKNMKKIADTLPSAISDNKIEAVAGTIWDSVTAYGTFGLLPSNGNNGGVLGEIPILSGNKDSVKEQLQVVSTNAPLYQEDSDKFIPIEQSDAYKQMSDEKKAQVEGLYISKEPVFISKDNATYQNGGNGIMNDKGLAIFNVLEQTGMIGQYQTDKKTSRSNSVL